jgi:hypothetical protein
MDVNTEFSDRCKLGMKNREEPPISSGNSVKRYDRDIKKIGSFMRRDKRKNAKPKEMIPNSSEKA